MPVRRCYRSGSHERSLSGQPPASGGSRERHSGLQLGPPLPKDSNIKSCLNVSLNLIFKSTMQMGIEKIYHGNTRCLKFLEVLIKHDYLLLKSNIYS